MIFTDSDLPKQLSELVSSGGNLDSMVESLQAAYLEQGVRSDRSDPASVTTPQVPDLRRWLEILMDSGTASPAAEGHTSEFAQLSSQLSALQNTLAGLFPGTPSSPDYMRSPWYGAPFLAWSSAQPVPNPAVPAQVEDSDTDKLLRELIGLIRDSTVRGTGGDEKRTENTFSEDCADVSNAERLSYYKKLESQSRSVEKIADQLRYSASASSAHSEPLQQRIRMLCQGGKGGAKFLVINDSAAAVPVYFRVVPPIDIAPKLWSTVDVTFSVEGKLILGGGQEQEIELDLGLGLDFPSEKFDMAIDVVSEESSIGRVWVSVLCR